jgi:hypothetical protein
MFQYRQILVRLRVYLATGARLLAEQARADAERQDSVTPRGIFEGAERVYTELAEKCQRLGDLAREARLSPQATAESRGGTPALVARHFTTSNLRARNPRVLCEACEAKPGRRHSRLPVQLPLSRAVERRAPYNV